MKRFAMEQLQSWKEKEKRKPMIIMGARQVGKTWLMKEFGRQFFPKVAYVSFYNNKRMSDVFEMDFDIQRILMNLNIETGVTITPGDTLIILDEIQDAPRVLESLKYFCEDAPEYHEPLLLKLSCCFWKKKILLFEVSQTPVLVCHC